MIFDLFRRSANNRAVVERLHGTIVAAARRPVLFTEFGLPDSFEGRFESLALHAALVVRHLQSARAPAPELAQALTDVIFRHFDRMLREMGVGDTAVPKRMKSLAEAFLGRGVAYKTAIDDGEVALSDALTRNVYGGRRDAAALTRYVLEIVEALRCVPIDRYAAGTFDYPDPANSLEFERLQRSAS